GEKTQSDYIREVKKFTIFLGRSPDQAQPEDLRLYQLHQREQGVQPPSMNGTVAALRFFFTTTCNRPEMARHLTLVRQPQKLPVVLTPEEVARLIEAAPSPKYRVFVESSGRFWSLMCEKAVHCLGILHYGWAWNVASKMDDTGSEAKPTALG